MTKPSPAPTDSPSLPEGPGAAFTFIYYFSGASLVATLMAIKTLGVGLGNTLTSELALAIGLAGGVLGTFYNRTKTLEVPFSSQKAFTQTLEKALMDMGYAHSETTGSLSVYRRSRLGRLFSGDIYAQYQEKSVIFVSRAGNIRALKKRLG